MWRALIRPPFNVIDPEILVRWKYLFPVAGIFICVLGIRISVFYLEQQDRKIWLFGICAMHVGIGVTMGMYLFSLVMIILNVAAFGPGLVSRRGQTDPFTAGESWFLGCNCGSAGCPVALDRGCHYDLPNV